VTGLRHRIFLHRRWAVALLALALLAKMILPVGFMPSAATGRISVELCSGYGVEKMAIVLPGSADHGQPQGEHGKAASPCTFSGLAAPGLAGIDPAIIAIAIAFVMAVGLRTATPAPVRLFAYLRPPLRGPPATL